MYTCYILCVYVTQVLGQFLEEALKMLETIKEGLVHAIISISSVHFCVLYLSLAYYIAISPSTLA